MTKYRVSGPVTVRGHQPGSVYEADYSEAKEARLIAAGLIKRVRSNANVHEGDADDQHEGGDDNA